MSIKLGNTTLSKAYFGSNQINKLYLGSTLVFGETAYPPQEDVTAVTWGTYVAPTSTPAYLGTVIDGINGMKVTRVAEETAFGIGDVVNKRHIYSRRNVWNSDNTLIALANDAKILDGSTYALLGTCTGFGSLGWSNTNPNQVFQSSASSNFFRIQTFNPTTYTVSTFFNKVFSDYNILSHHTNEANVSNDDKYVALYGTKVATGTDCWVVVYDIELDSIISETNLGVVFATIDWISISQLGARVVVVYGSDGSGATEGIWSYNRLMGDAVKVTDGRGHGDLGVDQQGNEVFVSMDLNGTSPTYRISYVDLVSGVKTGLLSQLNATFGGGHVSCRNIDRAGWAYYSSGYDTFTGGQLEIIAMKLDSSNTIERYCKHNTALYATKYYHQAHAIPNRDGTKVMFASDWQDTALEAKTYAPAFVVEKNIVTELYTKSDVVSLGTNETNSLGDIIEVGEGTLSIVTGSGATGSSSYYAKLIGSNAGSERIQIYWSGLVIGNDYTFSAYLKKVNNSCELNSWTNVTALDGSVADPKIGGGAEFISDEVWTKYSYPLRVTATSGICRFYVGSSNDSEVHVDSFSITLLADNS